MLGRRNFAFQEARISLDIELADKTGGGCTTKYWDSLSGSEVIRLSSQDEMRSANKPSTQWGENLAFAEVTLPETVASKLNVSLPTTPSNHQASQKHFGTFYSGPGTTSPFPFGWRDRPNFLRRHLTFSTGRVVDTFQKETSGTVDLHTLPNEMGFSGGGIGFEEGTHSHIHQGDKEFHSVDPAGLALRTDNPAYLCGYAKYCWKSNTLAEKRKLQQNLYFAEKLQKMHPVCPRQVGLMKKDFLEK
eukprot:TRINITY_DN113951_c0_g1_i1.p1 TRINITY_DN113951_c0_g1~~TRINITY_DN113951_c0_g1_i1.p1  ORF type:complete len:246 (-),score=10.79 TRINITY_DN113951_c0_g1_i1:217-954(-)